MDAKEYVSNLTRDAVVIDAMRDAVVAMSLTTGASIGLEGVIGILNFERPIRKLQTALVLLGAEIEAPAPARATENDLD